MKKNPLSLRLTAGILLASMAGFANAQAELKLPFSEESVATDLADKVFYWDELKSKSEVTKQMLVIDGLMYANPVNWLTHTADSIESLEAKLGEHIPGRTELQRWHIANGGQVTYKALKYMGDYSTRAETLPNRMMFAVDNSSGKVVMFYDWNPNRIERIYEARKANQNERVQPMPRDTVRYIESELKKPRPFVGTPERSEAHARKAVQPIGAIYDSTIPFEEKPVPFKAPYLWGKLEWTVDARIDGSRQFVHHSEAFPMDYSVYKGKFISNLSEVEKELGHQIPLREIQLKWLNTPDESYFIFVRNPDRVGIQYENLIYAYDASDHQSFMTILWNSPD